MWSTWLLAELEARGFEVTAPVLPNPRLPRLVRWLDVLTQAAAKLDKNTTIVAYSLGTPTALRFLNDYPGKVRIAGLVLVAGFGDGIRERPGTLFSPPLDFELIKSRAKNRVVIYSSNDYLINPKRSRRLAEAIEAKEVVVLDAGHFVGIKGLPGSIDRLPTVLAAVLNGYPPGFRGRAGALWQGLKRRFLRA
jgi:predicted alpha/beta hydrolase family esterase